MIKKLKRKFLCVSLLSIVIVVFIIVGYINIHNYTTTINKHNRVLDIVVSSNTTNEESSEFEKIIYRNIIIIEIIDNNPVLIQGRLGEEHTVESVYDVITKTNKDKGKVDTFIYRITNSNDTNRIIISNYEIDKQLISSFILNSVIISVIGIIIIFIFIYFTSSYVMKPFVKNEEQQKEFITNASHELKTPITIIKANLDVLKIEEVNNEWTQSIEDQTSRLEFLTTNLISLSKLEEQKNSLIKTDFSLTDAVIEEVQNYKVLLKEKNIECLENIKNNVTYFGDEKQIRYVIRLILDNVVKYANEGLMQINLDNKEINIANNTTLSDGNYNNIFNRFTRLDESRNQTKYGFGIGLSIVQKIIDNHQCSINATVCDNIFTIKIKL